MGQFYFRRSHKASEAFRAVNEQWKWRASDCRLAKTTLLKRHRLNGHWIEQHRIGLTNIWSKKMRKGHNGPPQTCDCVNVSRDAPHSSSLLQPCVVFFPFRQILYTTSHAFFLRRHIALKYFIWAWMQFELLLFYGCDRPTAWPVPDGNVENACIHSQ